MHHVIDSNNIVEWIGAWGYVAIFVFVFVGNLGIPVPEETVLLAAGFLSAHGALDLSTTYVVALVSAVIGDNCGYLIGRTGGQHLLDRLANHFEFVRKRYVPFKTFFERYGNKTVFMARFIAGLRFMAGPMAGAAGMPFWRFFGWNVLGAIVWCAAMVALGHMIGDQWDYVAGVLHATGRWIVLALAVIAIAAYFVWREHQSPAAPPQP